MLVIVAIDANIRRASKMARGENLAQILAPVLATRSWQPDTGEASGSEATVLTLLGGNSVFLRIHSPYFFSWISHHQFPLIKALLDSRPLVEGNSDIPSVTRIMAEADVRQRTTANGTPDGASSATKRSQDSKGPSAKEGSRTSRSVSSTSARSPSAGEKKIPPIKAPVGLTPPPKIKQAKSKIGSLENVTHKPKGGEKKVESRKLEWNAKPKVGSLDYATHKPGGGDKKIVTQKVDFKNVQSKVGSKDNLNHKPGGGNLKIATEKLDFKAKAAPKVGSLDNAKHKPGGGNVPIKSEKLHFKDKAAPKIHSRSGSERGSSHGGSETQSPVMPSSPAPPEGMPPLNEDESLSSQEEPKPEKVECNGDGENAQGPPSTDASPTKSPEKAENASTEDQLIAF